MVASITSLTRNGLADYVIQRVSAVLIAVYVLCVLAFLLGNPSLNYRELTDFFGNPVMRWFTQITILATGAHAWIGMWTVITDYVRPHYFGKAETVARAVLQALCILAVLIYMAWGTQVIWSF